MAPERAISWAVMFDEAAVDLCARCLADAAAHEGDEHDLNLSATALARDIADTHRVHASALLALAARRAAAHLDQSALDRHRFAQALRRLASLHASAGAKLATA
jgi:hypothetical protein